jgi:hypothetical protein
VCREGSYDGLESNPRCRCYRAEISSSSHARARWTMPSAIIFGDLIGKLEACGSCAKCGRWGATASIGSSRSTTPARSCLLGREISGGLALTTWALDALPATTRCRPERAPIRLGGLGLVTRNKITGRPPTPELCLRDVQRKMRPMENLRLIQKSPLPNGRPPACLCAVRRACADRQGPAGKPKASTAMSYAWVSWDKADDPHFTCVM